MRHAGDAVRGIAGHAEGQGGLQFLASLPHSPDGAAGPAAQLPGGGAEIFERSGRGPEILLRVEFPAIASFDGQALRRISA